jgi:hypothetical protein
MNISVQIYALLLPAISVGYRTAYFINPVKHSLLEFFNIYMCGGTNIRGSFCKRAARYEFLKGMVIQTQVFWSVIPRRLVNSYRLFGELSYLHLQGEVVVSLKLQAISSSEKAVKIYEAILFNIPQDSILLQMTRPFESYVQTVTDNDAFIWLFSFLESFS